MQRLIKNWPLYFFVAAVMLCAVSATRFMISVSKPASKRAQSTSDVTYVYNLARTPFVEVGDFKYAILGFGQNADNGAQLIWVRSITSGRTGGFAVGERLFGGPVKVSGIEAGEITLSHKGRAVGIDVE